MDVVGYADRLSVRPGESIQFMVSCRASTFDASIVRLVHGDTNPGGPGFKELPVPTDIDGSYEGCVQPIRPGSYVVVDDRPALSLTGPLTLRAWIYPTTPGGRIQSVLAKVTPEGAGYGLFLDENGALLFHAGDGNSTTRLTTGVPLRAHAWYLVAAAHDPASGSGLVFQTPAQSWPGDGSTAPASAHALLPACGATDVPLLMAASWLRDAAGELVPGNHFNGKIDGPKIFGRALSDREIVRMAHRESRGADTDVVAAWDFSLDIDTDRVIDTAASGLHGRTVNYPTRAVTGANWTGRETDFRLAHAEYGAIHFHDDDLDDAGWSPTFALTVPLDLRSGIYAARLGAGEAEDHVPFVVAPARGRQTARAVLLVPTLTYMAYGNEHMWNNPVLAAIESNYAPESGDAFENIEALLSVEDDYIVENRLNSIYDYHSDGSGVCYSSRLRPLLQMRPRYRAITALGPHGLAADLHLVDWLEAKGYAYDVVTDEDLHSEGPGLLRPYRVVLTGSHPEYWTLQMLDAVESYLSAGGRLMYLGGNGFYWVTSVDPACPHVIEVRRGHAGSGPWQSPPGECHHSSTGELGGLWRHRGRAPQRLVGVGFTAQGWGDGRPFEREDRSHDSRASFVLEGVEDESIGVEGLILGGAASLELDRVDLGLGTPPHAVTLASASGFSDSYQGVREDMLFCDSRQGGTVNPLVRADIVYFGTPEGGGVFSTGAIGWCGCLSAESYDGPVSRITENVLRAFLREDSGASEVT